MNISDHLSFGWRRKLPLILQTEATECGLACVAMIASFFGFQSDLATLRRRFSISLSGAKLTDLIRIASNMKLAARPVRVELKGLSQLSLPAILHWEFNHFVVLKVVDARSITVHDPARGARKIPMDQAALLFTGVALELWPNEGFEPGVHVQNIKLRKLMGRISGLFRSFAQILALALALEVCALIGPFFMQWTIDHAIVSADRDLLATLAVGFGMLMLLQNALGTMRSWMILYMGTTINIQWRANVFSHLVRLPIEYFAKRHLGDVVSRFGSVDQIQRTLTTSFLEALLDGMMALATVVLMFAYSITLGWIVLLAMAIYCAIRYAWYTPLRNASEEQIVCAAKQQSHFLETIRGVKSIKLFGQQETRAASWLGLVVEQFNADLRTQKMNMLYRLVNGLLFGIENIVVVWLGARLVLDGQFTVGVMMAFMSYKSQFEGRFSSLVDKFFEVKMLQLQGERLADIVLTQPEEISGIAVPESGGALPDIEVRELTYRYSEFEPLVLSGVTFNVRAGESVAVVGPSGCGKTTLMNILLGIFAPTSGDVIIGGVSLKACGVERLRSMIGTVLQDDVLFAGSIMDNISFFAQDVDHSWAKECARMAAVEHEIETMPMAFDTLIGDMGTVLSGGQKQRVLLARALYKRPKILLLDEATSHLDVEKEFEVNRLIGGLAVTRIIVAHRPETIASADRIVYMADGIIVDEHAAAAVAGRVLSVSTDSARPADCQCERRPAR